MLRNFNRLVSRHSNFLKLTAGGPRRRFYSAGGKFVTETRSVAIATAVVGIGGYIAFKEFIEQVSCETKVDKKQHDAKRHEVIRDDLPYFTVEELAQHDNKEKGIWTSYGVGVYDVTLLIDKHGTPETTILLAAGMALDPFWDDPEMKVLHDKPYIYDMLEKCRIGNVIKN